MSNTEVIYKRHMRTKYGKTYEVLETNRGFFVEVKDLLGNISRKGPYAYLQSATRWADSRVNATASPFLVFADAQYQAPVIASQEPATLNPEDAEAHRLIYGDD